FVGRSSNSSRSSRIWISFRLRIDQILGPLNTWMAKIFIVKRLNIEDKTCLTGSLSIFFENNKLVQDLLFARIKLLIIPENQGCKNPVQLITVEKFNKSLAILSQVNIYLVLDTKKNAVKYDSKG